MLIWALVVAALAGLLTLLVGWDWEQAVIVAGLASIFLPLLWAMVFHWDDHDNYPRR